jgi:hypothetical protein
MSPPNLRSADLREAVARALYEHWCAEDFNTEYCAWGMLAGKDQWLERADAILPLIAQAQAEERAAIADYVDALDPPLADNIRHGDHLRALGAGEAG